METGLSATNHNSRGKDMTAFSREILEAVYNNVQEGILLIDNKGCLIEINTAGMEIHELEHSAIGFYLNNPFCFFRVFNSERQELSEDRGPVARLLNREPFNKETYIVKLKEHGSELRISYTSIPHYDNEGNFSGGILFAKNPGEINIQTELTKDVFAKEEQLKQFEIYQQQLKNDKKLLQTIIDTIPVMVTIYDKRIPSVVINQAFENITGWTKEDIPDANILKPAFADPTDGKEIISLMPPLEPGFKDIRIPTRAGRFIDASWTNIEIADGRDRKSVV